MIQIQETWIFYYKNLPPWNFCFPKFRKLGNVYPSSIVWFHTLNNSVNNNFSNLIYEFVQLHWTTSLRFDPIDNFFSKPGRTIELQWWNRSIVIRIHWREPSRRSFCDSKLPRIKKCSFCCLIYRLSQNLYSSIARFI